MKIILVKRFMKSFKKLPKKIKTQALERIALFKKDRNLPILKDHPLRGNMMYYRSFSVSGNYRIIYRVIDGELIKFIDIGTHPQVYS